MKLHLPLSLRKTVLSYLLTAFSITIAAGAIEYLQDDSGLQDGNQTRETLTLENGQQMTLNGNSVDSSLNFSDGTLSLDYGSATAPSSMQGNDLTLSGGTTLHLIPGTTTDGKYINLLTNVGTLYGADGSQLIFSSANNAASQYFDTSQPGSGYWKDATLQLTPDGTLQMQLHNETVKNALTITARKTGSVNYCYYESISFEDIVCYSTSFEASGGAIYGDSLSTITLSNNGSVTFSGNSATSTGSSAYGGAIYGNYDSTINLSNNGTVTF
ncbi:MAG: hypothetical protein Q4F35_06740, partial [Akkermansia sp.]|nr:hypothetical protein [Akkermansia sp.]